MPIRFWLAGPLAFILSLCLMAVLILCLPHQGNNGLSDSQLYHMIFPTILFPLIWAGCFFYPLLDSNLKRASSIMLGLLFLSSVIIFLMR
ncbi:hypothetical protein [Psychrobacter sp. I-STPA10]|uniref:hypothetical protein n=1 Tax=Psychrobacter sp. I-STPA10 TaxID=2585769 RepID=UPI001E5EC938|nr:hypothetical protein [Psychrobacter sp. I-STPA10]